MYEFKFLSNDEISQISFQGGTKTAEVIDGLGDKVASGIGIMRVAADENATLDHTWQEMRDFMANGGFVFFVNVDADEDQETVSTLTEFKTHYSNGEYSVLISNLTYTTDSPDGYPVQGTE